IYPGFKFNSGLTHLITNFHIPKSSLLALVYAFGGEERIKRAYTRAIENKYYFFSLGDAMMMDKEN
ncbi:MAG: S-adenosylmethionine:tRNA ribosyltransferase-isomerase, partial [Thermoplasmata archaeon]